MTLTHQFNSQSSSSTKRCSSSIQERIAALQSSGCCLQQQQQKQPHPQPHPQQQPQPQPQKQQQQQHKVTRPIGRVSKRPSLNLSDLNAPIYSFDTTVSSLDLSNSIKLPLTPCFDADDEPARLPQNRGVSFANMADVCFIPQLDDTVDYDALYYKEDELADFRHEAFLEDCGLTNLI